jgi:hypothetical protein
MIQTNKETKSHRKIVRLPCQVPIISKSFALDMAYSQSGSFSQSMYKKISAATEVSKASPLQGKGKD